MYSEYVQYFNVYINSGGGRYFRIDCPYCDDHKGHMHLFKDSWIGHCFRCGTRKHIHYMLLKIGVEPPVRTIQNSFQLKNKILSNSDNTLLDPPEIELPRGSIFIGNLPENKYFKKVFDTLKCWKISLETAKSLQWNWNPVSDSFIFPCFMFGKLVYYTTRSLNRRRSAAKGEFSKYGILYNYDSELADSEEKVYIVEGPKDAASFYQNKMWAIALLGHNISTYQYQRLQMLPQDKVLCLDADVFSTSEKFQSKYGWETIYLPNGDPADLIESLPDKVKETKFSSKIYQLIHNKTKI